VAQEYGPVGRNVPTTPAQQTAINQAVQFLESVGENLSGITVSAADLKGAAPAAASGDGTKIGIDFDRLQEVVPPATPGAPGHPGLLVILLFHELGHVHHELGHVHHGWGRSFCDEVGLTVQVAQKHWQFICDIQAAGGGPLDALCKMYEHIRGKVNDPATRAEITKQGCAGSTGPIPACECCAGN
jgi:hypothetical protein